MGMDKNLSDLLNKYHNDACSKEEIELLETWFEEIAKGRSGEEPTQKLVDEMEAAIKRSPRFATKTTPGWVIFKAFVGRYRSMAASLVFACVAAVMAYQFGGSLSEKPNQLANSEILPGSNKAMLTLADGSIIVLNDRVDSLIARQEGMAISTYERGLLAYTVEGDDQASPEATNTLTTPRGGSFRVALPDGSTAWLNAASTLTYPLAFGGNERKVRMTGEVYFDIEKSYGNGAGEPIPFVVETDKQTIQVLGTQFNVNSYTENPVERTTLLTGSVKVTARASGRSELLSPNMEARIADKIAVMPADVDRSVAWKNGDFIFRNEPLSDILKEVMRWYDVEIVCPESLGSIRFNGMVSRQQPLSAVMDMIAITEKVRLEVKERRIIITE